MAGFLRVLLLIAVAAALALAGAGCGSGEDEAGGAEQGETVSTGREAKAAALEGYRSYLEKTAADLVSKVELLVAPLQTEKISRGQSFYVTARVPYGQIELFSQAFPTLDPGINGVEGEVPANEFAGFHRIEKALWEERSTKDIVPVGKKLLADAEALQGLPQEVRVFEPGLIVQVAIRQLREIPAVKLKGKEERYGDSDMVVVSANIEGAEAVFEAVKPHLAEKDPELMAEIEASFEGIYKTLKDSIGLPAREPEQARANAPGVSFRPYSELGADELGELQQQVEALTKQLSEALGQLPKAAA